MAEPNQKPVIFLAFANDRQQSGQYLRNLGQEAARLRSVLKKAEADGLCELVERPSVTPDDISEVLRQYKNRVAVFHYAGHAEDYELLLETPQGDHFMAEARSLAAVLRHQTSLQLVFLNACSTRAQVNDLLAAGVRAVVATSRAVDDELATHFAANFYQLLAAGESIATAFARATDERQFAMGDLSRHLRPADPRQDHAATGWPWGMYVQHGAELAQAWNLPQAAGDPLFGLPPLPDDLDLPVSPYRRLEWYTREQAELFFGRGQQIRDLYQRVTEPGGAPILLLYGQSGVGKSSLLDAGLCPRLERDYLTSYCRRDQKLGLLGTLQDALKSDSADAWRETEAQEGKPLVVIVDQLEEVFTRRNENLPDELDNFLATLQDLFADRTRRPQGKLILGFRKEWLAEFEKQLQEHSIAFCKVFLHRLDHAGILEVVRGPVQSPRLQRRYGLTIDPDLPREIADDLLLDPHSPVATVLQILLTKLWDTAYERNQSAPHFDQALYHQLKRKGIDLDDFLKQQLQALCSWQPQVVESGLALDLLAFHTTSHGTAEQRAEGEVQTAYANAQDLPTLMQKNKDLYLLADTVEDQATSTKSTRLAHDTLAPLVRKLFDESDTPGQRARRILVNRAVDRQRDANGTAQTVKPLDAADLADVEAGAAGMRAWTDAEIRLVEASRVARRRRALVRRVVTGLGIFGVLVIIIIAIVARYQWRNSQLNLAESLGRYSLSLLKERKDLEAFVQAIKSGKILQSQRTTNPEGLNALQTLLVRGSERNRLEGHTEAVRSVRFSPDGKTVASGSDDKTIKLWDLETGKIRTLTGHEYPVTSVSFSHNGKTVVSGSNDNTIKLWNVATGTEILPPLTGHESFVTSVSFSPDGKTVASGSDDKTIKLWDLETGEIRTLTGHTEAVRSVSFSRDGKTVVSGSADKTIKLWDLETGEIRTLTGHESFVTSVSFSRDGKTVVSGSEDKTIKLWDLETGEIRTLTGHEYPVTSVSFSPDGKTVASGGRSKTIKLWNVATGEEIRTFHGDDDYTQSVSFSRDGKTLASSGSSTTIKLWNLEPGKEIRTLTGHKNSVTSVSFSPDGKTVVSGSHDNTIKHWNAATGEEMPPFQGDDDNTQSVSFSPDGKTLAFGSGIAENTIIKLRNVETGTEILPPLTGHESFVTSVSFSPDGKTVVSGSHDTTIKLWDLETGETRTLTGHENPVFSVSFSYNGKTLASGSQFRGKAGTGVRDSTIKLWNVATGEEIRTPTPLTGHENSVMSVSFSPDGKTVASGSEDSTIKLWNVATGEEIHTLTGHDNSVLSVSFSPDGNTVASGSGDKTIKLWNVATGKEIRTLTGHENSVMSVSFSRDSKTLVSGSADRTIKLWHLPDLELDRLMERSCNWVRDYLQTNPKVKADKHLCDGIGMAR